MRPCRRLCTLAADAHKSGTLSVRDRLRRQEAPQDILDHIRAIGIARARGKRAPPPTRLGDREMGRIKEISSARSADELPTRAIDEVAFAGRSNVGKSSLLNALAGKRSGITSTTGIAPVKNSPGVTKTIDFYSSHRKAPRLVDLPGYGFAFADPEAVASWQVA